MLKIIRKFIDLHGPEQREKLKIRRRQPIQRIGWDEFEKALDEAEDQGFKVEWVTYSKILIPDKEDGKIKLLHGVLMCRKHITSGTIKLIIKVHYNLLKSKIWR